jgi:hypothetical protein
MVDLEISAAILISKKTRSTWSDVFGEVSIHGDISQ